MATDGDDERPVSQEVEDAFEPFVWNVFAMRQDVIEGTTFLIRAVDGAEPPDRAEVSAWLERFAEHGHRSDEFRMLGIPEDIGDETMSPEARRLHTALTSTLVLLLYGDDEARAMMLSVDEIVERIETPEVAGRWE